MRKEREEGGVKQAAGESSSPFFLYADIERGLILDIVEECCSQRQRDLLLMHYGRNFPLARIAREFGVSASAITQLHTGALRGMLLALGRMGIKSRREI
jgi:DNA-directed RNA polymerase specialized sigma24 family protein